ncbi:hypothetical protein PQR52_16785 [Paraburkholderia aspalathi]|uniref:hypothetical protein n=1 Tax=Paraburkholderia aspalathi TaxID=1324617 RepID=UPI0038B9205C
MQQYGFWYRPGVRGFEVLLDSEDTCTGAYTYADADAYTYTYTYTYTDSDSDSDSNADTHTDANTDTDTHTDANADADSNTDSNTDAYAYAGIRHRLRSTNVSNRRHRQWPDRHRHAKQQRHTPFQSRQQLPGVVRHRGDIGGHRRLVDAGSARQHKRQRFVRRCERDAD